MAVKARYEVYVFGVLVQIGIADVSILGVLDSVIVVENTAIYPD